MARIKRRRSPNIRVDNSHLETCMPYQRILWRESNEDAVQTYELTTVTYGTASASYLAIKALQQTAIATKDSQPFGAEIILRDFYVDDLLTGTNCKTEAQRIITEVTNILAKGKFELRKWASNEPEFQSIPTSCTGSTILNHKQTTKVRVLTLLVYSGALPQIHYSIH
ncbi:hypothetical protein QE152_g28981 [Popillia japonica]|uniref:Reverse transcriptase n=1 Tax=Popillia japonica TaxID=7064 RepID=A0AAW1JJH7_POPJA